MRVTVDLIPHAFQKAKRLAKQQQTSFSSTLAELVMIGLNAQHEPSACALRHDPDTGFPVFSSGDTTTTGEVAQLIDENYR